MSVAAGAARAGDGEPLVPWLSHLPGCRRARTHRRQRRKRRRWGGHLRLGRRPVRLPDPVLHGAGHRGLRLHPRDGGPSGRPYRQGPGRSHPRAVLLASVRLCRRRLRRGQRRAGGHRVRRHRHRLRAVRRVALHLGAHCRRGHLELGHRRLLPLRRAGLPAADPGLHHLPDRHDPRAPRLEGGGGQHRHPPRHRDPRPSCWWRWPSSAPPSPPTSSSTRPERWSTGASVPRSTSTSGSTP